MADTPVLEYIAQNVEEAMKGIRVSAGYFADVAQVERFRRGNFVEPFPAVAIYTLDEVDVPPEEGTIGFEERWVNLVLEGWWQEREAGKLDAELIFFQADLYRAMTEDPSRGDYAIDTQLRGVRKGLVIPPNVATIQVSFAIHYRFAFGHPEAPGN